MNYFILFAWLISFGGGIAMFPLFGALAFATGGIFPPILREQFVLEDLHSLKAKPKWRILHIHQAIFQVAFLWSIQGFSSSVFQTIGFATASIAVTAVLVGNYLIRYESILKD